MNNGLNGISDIASSEGNLLDFSKIVWIIGHEKLVSKHKILLRFQEITGSTSKGSFERKLSIVEKLNLVEFFAEKYLLNSWGKILCKILEDHNKMDDKLRSFYFVLLFSSIARNQLSQLLKVIDKQHGKEKKQLILDYFTTEVAKKIWNKKILEKNIREMKEYNILPSMFNNKFSCMIKWLDILGLIEVKLGGYYPQLKHETIKSLNKIERVENIFEDAAVIRFKEFRFFDKKQDYGKLVKLVKYTHNLFCTSESRLSDIQAVSGFICLEFLNQGIVIEQQLFFTITSKLKENGIIRSIMAGRDGTPKNMRLV